MYDTVIVQILYTERQLVNDLTDSFLIKTVTAALHVIEEISSFHVFENNVVVLTVLKEIDEVDDVGMLAHLEDFNLTSLLEHFYVIHILLFHLFDGYFLA